MLDPRLEMLLRRRRLWVRCILFHHWPGGFVSKQETGTSRMEAIRVRVEKRLFGHILVTVVLLVLD